MRNLTPPFVDIILMLGAAFFCLCFGVALVNQQPNDPVGWMVVFIGVVNLWNAWRMHRKMRQEKS